MFNLEPMMTKIKVLLGAALVCSFTATAWALPTQTVWMPNDKTQTDGRFRFDSDVRFTLDKRASDTDIQVPFIDEGVTYGLFNNNTVAGELGFDWWEPQAQDNLRCLHFHFKFAVIEEDKFPGVVLGFYNFGVKSNTTDQNILYLGLGKTWDPGHFFLGYFAGNQNVLVDERGNPQNTGLMFSWERMFPSVGKHFGLTADFQSSTSQVGAVNFAVEWKVKDAYQVQLGYDIFNNRNLNQRDTIQVQALMQL
jgi:hypothetical protein